MRIKTRVMRDTTSQAVLIPKAFELPDSDVYVKKRDGGLFITPIQERWDLFFAEPGVQLPFDAATLRDNRPSREIQSISKKDVNPNDLPPQRPRAAVTACARLTSSSQIRDGSARCTISSSSSSSHHAPCSISYCNCPGAHPA